MNHAIASSFSRHIMFSYIFQALTLLVAGFGAVEVWYGLGHSGFFRMAILVLCTVVNVAMFFFHFYIRARFRFLKELNERADSLDWTTRYKPPA